MSVAIRVIPCLDVDAGRVVKGVNFENLRDAGDPVELARSYGEQGADELTFLDVTASSGDRATTYDVVRRTAEQVFIPLTVGGGVRTVDDVDRLLRSGADKVGVNTAAIARPELIAETADRFGSQVLVLSADVRRRRRDDGSVTDDVEVTTHGGRTGTGLDAIEWCVRAAELGAGEILLNSMDADGTEGRLRPRPHRPGAPRGEHPRHRQRRRRRGRALRPGRAGRRRRGARRQRLPLRRPDHRPGQGRAARRGPPRPLTGRDRQRGRSGRPRSVRRVLGGRSPRCRRPPGVRMP